MRLRPSRAALAGLLLLAACGTGESPGPSGTEPTPPGLCRIGPDDGPPVADRGIGGTGAPIQTADRGIGGTGAPARMADRGIGGTGIIAVITGFASICLGGTEVALDDSVPVTLNGAAVSATALRAGQLAIVEASGSATALTARSVALRQEVSGPVESVGTDGRLRVAGQPVRVSGATFGLRHPLVGDWVAISGLRAPDGTIQATRIDPRAPGEVLIRGRAVTADGALRIGGAQIRPDGTPAESGYVTATGQYRAGVLDAARLAPDHLATDPAAAFPQATRRILVESYAAAAPGGLRLGSGAVLAAPAGLGGAAPRRSVVEVERLPGGGLRATGLRLEHPGPAGGPAEAAPIAPGMGRPAGPGAALRSQPAPVPRRMVAPGAVRAAAPGGMARQPRAGALPGGRLVPGVDGAPPADPRTLPPPTAPGGRADGGERGPGGFRPPR